MIITVTAIAVKASEQAKNSDDVISPNMLTPIVNLPQNQLGSFKGYGVLHKDSCQTSVSCAGRVSGQKVTLDESGGSDLS